MRLFIPLCFLLICSPLFAQSKAIVSGPSTAVVGDLVSLDAAVSTGEVFKWTFIGIEAPRQSILYSEGLRLAFIPEKPGTYTILLAAADSTPSVDATIHTITISGASSRLSMRATIDGKTNISPALPNFGIPQRKTAVLPRSLVATSRRIVQPDPQIRLTILPKGKYGLAPYTYRAIKQLVDERHYPVCPRIATNFREIADAIDSKAIKYHAAAMASLGFKNANDINGGKAAWESFFNEMKKRYNELSASGDLITISDYAIAFRETAEGLEALWE